LVNLQWLDNYGVAWKSFTEQYMDSTGMFRDAVIAILATIAKQGHARSQKCRTDADVLTVILTLSLLR
jgi:hypothetical protein